MEVSLGPTKTQDPVWLSPHRFQFASGAGSGGESTAPFIDAVSTTAANLSAAHHPVGVRSPSGIRRPAERAAFLQLYSVPSQTPSSLDISGIVMLGAADKAVNLGGCKSLHRQLPDNGRLVYPLFSEVTD